MNILGFLLKDCGSGIQAGSRTAGRHIGVQRGRSQTPKIAAVLTGEACDFVMMELSSLLVLLMVAAKIGAETGAAVVDGDSGTYNLDGVRREMGAVAGRDSSAWTKMRHLLSKEAENCGDWGYLQEGVELDLAGRQCHHRPHQIRFRIRWHYFLDFQRTRKCQSTVADAGDATVLSDVTLETSCCVFVKVHRQRKPEERGPPLNE